VKTYTFAAVELLQQQHLQQFIIRMMTSS